MNRWRLHATPQGGHEIELLRGGDALFPAMCAAIASAEDEIWLVSYIVHTDTASTLLAQALVAAAARGVRVRIVVDGFGARHALDWWRQAIDGSSVALAVFRPINRWWHWLQPGQLRRLHQKLCVVDQRWAFVGGINLIDDRIDLRHGALAQPRLDFAVQFSGPLVPEVQQAARRLWARSWLGRDFGDELVGLVTDSEPLQRARDWLRQRWQDWRGARAQTLALRQERRLALRNMTPVRVAFVVRDNLRNRHTIEREYLHALREARHQIDLICPYFYPSGRLMRALVRTARRGVQVRLLLQGQFDYRMAELATRALYTNLLAQGVRIFEYHAAYLHAKVAQVDGLWATVGSSNLDPTSLLLNLEANVVVWDQQFATQVQQAFELALQGAAEIHPETPLPAWQGWRGWLRRTFVAWVAQVYLRAAGGGERY
jgi:cardiolipin synthase A/B